MEGTNRRQDRSEVEEKRGKKQRERWRRRTRRDGGGVFLLRHRLPLAGLVFELDARL